MSEKNKQEESKSGSKILNWLIGIVLAAISIFSAVKFFGKKSLPDLPQAVKRSEKVNNVMSQSSELNLQSAQNELSRFEIRKSLRNLENFFNNIRTRNRLEDTKEILDQNGEIILLYQRAEGINRFIFFKPEEGVDITYDKDKKRFLVKRDDKIVCEMVAEKSGKLEIYFDGKKSEHSMDIRYGNTIYISASPEPIGYVIFPDYSIVTARELEEETRSFVEDIRREIRSEQEQRER